MDPTTVFIVLQCIINIALVRFVFLTNKRLDRLERPYGFRDS